MLIYNIPASLLNSYSDKTITIRSDNASNLAEAFSMAPRENLSCLQVLSLDCDADVLLHLSDSTAIDLVVDDPPAEFGKLYLFAELLQRHLVRATVRAVPGMTKAVKIAQALNFGVKLEINQPEASLVNELVTLAEYFLRGSTVGSPVEPFHSLFLSFFSDRPASLWSLQEENPSVDRYVTDSGQMAFSKRLVSLGIPEDQFPGFLEQHMSACLKAGECATCEFFSRCGGFFKLPDKGYQCDHIKRLFAILKEAAAEMRKDEEQFVELHGPDIAASDSAPTALQKGASPCAPTVGDEKQDVLSSFSMNRLDYRLEEFTRHSWLNDEVRSVWAPRISRVSSCLAALEWKSILEGLRACALRSVTPDELDSFTAELSGYGLSIASLEKVAVQDSYANSFKRPQEGEPFHYWCAIGKESDVQLFESAYSSHDDKAIGRLLGYPPCCIDFFNRVWVAEGFVDTTWPMAQNTASKRFISPTHLEIAGEASCNQLLRWLGLRIAIHLPCSFDCQPTIELAGKFTEVAKSAGFRQEMDWLEEMLNWPIEWTALNGLLEITTPVGTISTVTDVTAETYRISYTGTAHAKPIDRTVTFPRDPLDEPSQDLEWYFSDNGFSSRQGMDLFHEPIIRLAATTLGQSAGNVLDLGCGNGVLVKKICQANGKRIPWGIDVSSDNVAHARQLSPQFSDNFVVSDIFDDCAVWSGDREFELVILSLIRLTEVDASRDEKLRRLIREHAKNLLVYAYEGDGTLEELARKTGVVLSKRGSDSNVALANLACL